MIYNEMRKAMTTTITNFSPETRWTTITGVERTYNPDGTTHKDEPFEIPLIGWTLIPDEGLCPVVLYDGKPDTLTSTNYVYKDGIERTSTWYIKELLD